MVLSIRSMLTEFFCELSAPRPSNSLPSVLMCVGVFCFLGMLVLLSFTENDLETYAQALSMLYLLWVRDGECCWTQHDRRTLAQQPGSPCLRSLGGCLRFTLVSMPRGSNRLVSFPLILSIKRADHLDIVHPFLGPILIVTYALLSNTLLLTVLVAILGNTFATINADAAAEVSCSHLALDQADINKSMFRKAVATLEGVKAGKLTDSAHASPRKLIKQTRCSAISFRSTWSL